MRHSAQMFQIWLAWRNGYILNYNTCNTNIMYVELYKRAHVISSPNKTA